MKDGYHDRSILAGIVGFLVFFAATTAVLTWSDRPTSKTSSQPVAFSHQLHAGELELECTTCHEFVEDETFAGRPTAETCSFCHSEDSVGDSPDDVKLVSLLSTGASLDWQPLFRQPSHVFYSHRRHVVVAEIECEVCHGDIASTAALPEQVETLTMTGCLDCHEENQAETDCTGCHR